MTDMLDSLRWSRTRRRVLDRDGHRCTVSRWLGGRCKGRLHVHHIVARDEGGDDELDNLGTACAAHHPMWESLRREIVRRMLAGEERPPRCRHQHRTSEARRLCEQRMALERERELSPA